jgi:hypothetical protein
MIYVERTTLSNVPIDRDKGAKQGRKHPRAMSSFRFQSPLGFFTQHVVNRDTPLRFRVVHLLSGGGLRAALTHYPLKKRTFILNM